MKLIIAYIPMDTISRVTRELEKAHVRGMSLSSVHGFGQEHDSLHPEHREFSDIVRMKKARLEIACHDEEVEPILGAIYRAAHTGLRGNGKILVLPVEEAMRLKTGERGDAALGRRGRHAATESRAKDHPPNNHTTAPCSTPSAD